MVKKALACGLSVLLLTLGYAGFSMSTSQEVPDQLTLTSKVSDKKPPVIFSHKMHQEAYECGDCHHGMSDDGKQVPYTEGMEIKKCEECHNADVLGGRKVGKYDMDDFKGAGHGNCLECHREVAKEDSSKKKLRSCNTCHIK